jgi:1,4-dihydroxy-2-naphthoate octaprenyltransferase
VEDGGRERRFDPRRARELLGGGGEGGGVLGRRRAGGSASGERVAPARAAAGSARELGGSARIWLMAARPRTLPAAVAPVLVGTALAAHDGDVNWLAFAAALIGAIAIQVGTNLSNDYSDARRGADADDRLGPVRVTAGGLLPPRQVLIATWASFAVAVLVGIYLIAIAGWALLVIGAASILAGVLYTGGPRPYGYEGLGELFVFLFFGIVAVTGSYFVQTEELPWEAFALAVPVGMLAAAILVVNNVRDIDSDRRAGKRTLVVRMGRHRARNLYAGLVYLAFPIPPLIWLTGGHDLHAWLALPWLALPLAVPLVRLVRNRTDGPSLNESLARTGLLQLAFCVLLAAGLLLS